MLTLIPAVLCLPSALGVLTLGRRTGFRYLWLVSAGAAFLVWAAAISVWYFLPSSQGSFHWPVENLFEPELAFHWDRMSAGLTVAFASLALTVILTDVQRAVELDRRSWGGSLLMTAFVLGGLQAGNLFTLVLFMGLLDLTIVAFQLLIQQDQFRIGLAVKGLIARGTGFFLLYLSASLYLFAGPDADPWLDAAVFLFLVSAFFLRLGILPLRWVSIEDAGVNRVLGTTMRLAPAGLAVVLLLRTELYVLPAAYLPWALILLALPSILSAWIWVSSPDEISGRSFFLIASSSIIVAGVLLEVPDASLAWSLALILSGAVLFLFKIRRSWFVILPLLGLWGYSGLPLSASWPAMQIYASPFNPILAFYLILQAGLLAGYLYHTFRLAEVDESLERWELALYPLGLVLLPLVNLMIVWLPWSRLQPVQGLPWWPGFAAILLGGGLWWLFQRGNLPRLDLSRPGGRLLGMLASGGSEAGSWFGRGIGFISSLLEGEGGVLWAFLFLALIITLIAQIGFRVFGNAS